MIYETEEDLRRESFVAEMVAGRWDCQQKKLGEVAPLDRALYRGEVLKAYIEIKCRNNAHNLYPDYLIDAAKIDAGLEVAAHDGVPFYLFVHFTDGLYWVKVEADTFSNRKVGGRKDRGDENDTEVCCFVPMSLFRRMS